MSFLSEEIYRPMNSLPGRPGPDRPRPYRFDEFPAGYPLRVALPQDPHPLNQPVRIVKRTEESTIEKQRTAGSVLTACLTRRDNPILTIKSQK
jgi:hypothetical protein